MVEDTIDARYAVVQDVLEAQLAIWFGAGNFTIIVRHPGAAEFVFGLMTDVGAAR